MADKQWLTVGVVAGRLDSSLWLVYQEIYRNALPAYKFGDRWRILAQDLETYISTAKTRQPRKKKPKGVTPPRRPQKETAGLQPGGDKASARVGRRDE